MRPLPAEYAEYYENYIAQTREDHPVRAMEKAAEKFVKIHESLTEAVGDFSYEAGKWTAKEVLAHIIDAERVFGYRALRFARGDTIELPGYEHNHWAVSAGANNRRVVSLLEEMDALRQSTLLLFNSFDDDMLVKKGIASGSQMSVRALGFIIAGHQTHHRKVLESKYFQTS